MKKPSMHSLPLVLALALSFGTGRTAGYGHAQCRKQEG